MVRGNSGMISKIIAWLAKVLKWDDMKDFTDLPYLPPNAPISENEGIVNEVAPPLPNSTPVPVSTAKNEGKATLTNFLTAIRDFEGYPGDANYRNNNPGNCRYNPSGYMPMYGIVKKSPAGFAIFPTYALGWLYLQNMVRGMIHKRPNETILEFMTRYAPESDNNPTVKYATFIAKRLGVDISFKIGDLVLV